MTEAVDAQYGTMLALFDGDGGLLLSNNPLTAESYPAHVRGRSPYDIRARDYEIRRLTRMDWRLVAFLDTDVMQGHMDGVLSISWLVSGVLVLTLTVFIVVIRQQIKVPVSRIIRFMENRPQNPSATLALRTRNEISVVADGMNHMLDELAAVTRENLKNLDKILRVELEQKRAENAALMSQINPHFLYNTLDSMRGMALSHGETAVARMISALAFIMRYSISGGAAATVREEVRTIERYMEIIGVRHFGRIRVSLDVAEDIGACVMPKMILQPIVENAVFHGLEPVSRAGHVTVSGRIDGDFLVFCVVDDGKGMTAAELDGLRESLYGDGDAPAVTAAGGEAMRGGTPGDISPGGDARRGYIGLRNIHRRLRLIYGEPCGIEIESGPDAGARVTIRLYSGAKNE